MRRVLASQARHYLRSLSSIRPALGAALPGVGARKCSSQSSASLGLLGGAPAGASVGDAAAACFAREEPARTAADVLVGFGPAGAVTLVSTGSAVGSTPRGSAAGSAASGSGRGSAIAGA